MKSLLVLTVFLFSCSDRESFFYKKSVARYPDSIEVLTIQGDTAIIIGSTPHQIEIKGRK